MTAAAFFSPLTRGFCTFYEKDSGSRIVFIEYLNVDNLDLKKLKTISTLVLPGNQISDITALSLVTNIQHLNLSGNYISDLAPLKDLKYLTHLELRDNQITDVTPLKDLTGLEFLDVSDNPVIDFKPIEELKQKLGGKLIV
jgi:Leucine-rich repeat (LRR) protein